MIALHHPKVSVIIPCYNLGHFLEEALYSVISQTYQNFEIIIVNDGSTQPDTLETLDRIALNHPHLTILHTSNQGLACARNNGIALAKGEYILPLDADDRIATTYLEKGVAILDTQPAVGIVYCQAEFYGEIVGKWNLPEYDLRRMLLDNIIFCSAFFRRSDWARSRGYDATMIYGWEDYDFWLSLIELGVEVVRIPETLFFYHQRTASMAKSMTRTQWVYSYTQLYRNHPSLYDENINVIFERMLEFRETMELAQIERDNFLLQVKSLEHALKANNEQIYHLSHSLNQTTQDLQDLRNTYTVRFSNMVTGQLRKLRHSLKKSAKLFS